MTVHAPYLWMLIALPLAGAIINGLFGKRLPRDFVASLACSTVGVAFAFSILLFFKLQGFDAVTQELFTWIFIDKLSIDFSLRIDQLSALMCLVVTGVSFLIHIYSVGYMKDDRSFARYFAYLNLFVFAMLLLVIADNLAVMFIGWEGVGLCSYLLIGFWYDDAAKASAGTKAFIANRIGDAGFLAGIILTFWGFYTLEFSTLAVSLKDAPINNPYITAIAVCFFIGAVGKSAQIPLYVWLPDAMAGPTPVSALIHAATMVTAGVYMVARLNFLYAASPDAMMLVSGIGASTALFAAIIAVGQNDIKKVLAYSTISQLGYMFVAVGVGAYTSGMFHLTTHAFFKACLFLCAGAVIHALHGEQDIRRMGGLRKRMPGIYWAFLISAAALAGIIPLSGFWSKDDILWSALLFKHSAVPLWWRYALWSAGLLTAFLTAFYMGRLAFLAFFGKERQSVDLHPTPLNMKFAIYVLAILAAVGGVLNTPFWPGLEHYLAPIFDSSTKLLAQHNVEFGFSTYAVIMMAVTLGVAVAGIALAWHLYLRRAEIPAKLAQNWRRTYALLTGKFYVDELYRALLYRPLAWLAEKFFGKKIESELVAGSMEMCAALFDGIGEKLRRLQSGKLSHYLLAMLAGLIFLLLFLL